MTTQTLSIVDTLDDGYAVSGTWDSTLTYMGGPSSNVPGLSFVTTAAVGAGATINQAYARVYMTAASSGVQQEKIAIENANPATNTRFSGSHLPSSATIFTGASMGSTQDFGINHPNRYVFGASDDLPLDLTADMQALINAFGAITIGNRINVVIVGIGGSGYAQLEDLTAAGGHPAQLFIDWTNASPPMGFGKISSNRKYFLPSEAALVIAALESKRRLSRRRFFQWLPGAFWKK